MEYADICKSRLSIWVEKNPSMHAISIYSLHPYVISLSSGLYGKIGITEKKTYFVEKVRFWNGNGIESEFNFKAESMGRWQWNTVLSLFCHRSDSKLHIFPSIPGPALNDVLKDENINIYKISRKYLMMFDWLLSHEHMLWKKKMDSTKCLFPMVMCVCVYMFVSARKSALFQVKDVDKS